MRVMIRGLEAWRRRSGSSFSRKRIRLRARRAWRMTIIVLGSLAGGLAAVWFAKFCDLGLAFHHDVVRKIPWLPYVVLPAGMALATWLTLKLAPAAAGSGIPQVIAAAEEAGPDNPGDEKTSLRTALVKIVLTALLLACGASVGREGPTVQVVAAILFAFTSRLHGGPSRRALLIAGGAAGVAAAFNTLIAGVVFAVEELAKGFDRRNNSIIILVVVVAGAASYAFAGDYAYFGSLRGSTALLSAWMVAPVIGVVCGVTGGLFARAVAAVIGPRPNAVGLFRRKRPIVFATGCGLIAALAAWASGGLSFGVGYDSTTALLAGDGAGAQSWSLAAWRWISTLAASICGAPGGLFAPSLAIGAGLGSAVDQVLPWVQGRDVVVLGMAAYLAGVVQAPLTSAVILMEMTRDPGLVGPLMLSTLMARAISSRIMREPLYHVLAGAWRRRVGRPGRRAARTVETPTQPA